MKRIVWIVLTALLLPACTPFARPGVEPDPEQSEQTSFLGMLSSTSVPLAASRKATVRL